MKRRIPVLGLALGLLLLVLPASSARADEVALNGVTANTTVSAEGTAEGPFIYFLISGRTGVATGVITIRWRARTSGAGSSWQKVAPTVTDPNNSDDGKGSIRIPSGVKHLQIQLSGYSGTVPVDVVVVGWRGTFS